ncbi:MAG: hypothetical protein H0V04_01780 [Chloroflexi bacterium]|nr:hypothetical protein [Chloroflexota bacterium]
MLRDDDRYDAGPGPEPRAEPQLRTRSARSPAIVVVLILVVVAGAGFLGRERPASPTTTRAPVAVSSTAGQSPAPPAASGAPTASRFPMLAPVDFAPRFWVVAIHEEAGPLERVSLSGGEPIFEGALAVRPEWDPRSVKIRLLGRRADGEVLRLAEVPLPAIPARAMDLPMELAAGAVTLGDERLVGLSPDQWRLSVLRHLVRWDHRLTLERGLGGTARVVARITVGRVSLSGEAGTGRRGAIDGRPGCSSIGTVRSARSEAVTEACFPVHAFDGG